MPKRIQRKRTKGWKMPKDAVYVGRPTKWGNPFPVGNGYTQESAVEEFSIFAQSEPYKSMVSEELRGKDLACWCPLDKPCHADVLLKIANSYHFR